MTGLDDARLWLDIVQGIVTFVIAIYVWLVNRQRATTAQIEAIKDSTKDRLDRHASRLTKIETNLEHVPSSSVIADLTSNLSELHGDLQYMKGWMKGIHGSFEQLKNSVTQLVENEMRERKS